MKEGSDQEKKARGGFPRDHALPDSIRDVESTANPIKSALDVAEWLGFHQRWVSLMN